MGGEKQRRKGKIYPFECRVPKNSKGDKKAFLGDQGKETEENNRMEISRDLFKKVGDTKGIADAKTGTIKDRNDKDLTEVEEIMKRWQDKIVLMMQINMMVWTLTQSQTLWSVKSSGP